MKKFIGLMFICVMLSGCGIAPISKSSSVSGSAAGVVGDTEMEGILVMQGENAVMQSSSGSVLLDSYSVKLADYDGKQVKVKGQYSGTTLFVDEIE